MKYFVRLIVYLIYMTLPLQAIAAPSTSHVEVQLIQEDETIQPGHPFWVALRFQIEPGWHAYWKNPGDAGVPLKVEWTLPEGFQSGPLEWPFPEKFTVEDMVGFGYEGEVVLLTQLIPPEKIEQPEVPVSAHIKWLVCSSSTCQPGAKPIKTSFKVAAHPPVPDHKWASFFYEARAKLPKSRVAFATLRKEGIVQIKMPADRNPDSVVGAYFFPEEQNVIDHKVEPVVNTKKDSDSHYVISLKGAEEIGASHKTLKGVLVLHTKEGNERGIQAFDIESPIAVNGDQELATLFSENKSSLGVGTAQYLASTAPSSQFEGGLGLALVFAFLGGMILNLMPCVLPVISFKVMSFVKMAGQSRRAVLKQGLLFSAGVVASFWVLAGVMLMLRTYGQAVGWGFQLQEPLFVAILASLLFVFSLSLFGVFELGMSFASWAGQTEIASKEKTSGEAGSFFSGVLATAVATPCTGPFLGSAVGFAVTLPIFQALLVFTSLALGMCFPYLLLAAFPSFLRYMPKPGAWMETFKQLMGFMLLATVLWLLWVFGAQTNTTALLFLIGSFLSFSMGAWVYGKWSTPLYSRPKRLLAYSFASAFLVMGCAILVVSKNFWHLEDGSPTAKKEASWDDWEPFSPERLAELRQQGTPVLIDFTAKWCLICQANHLVLNHHEVEKTLKDSGVVKMKADWTKNDPVITEALSQFGRTSVPLYVFYGSEPDQEPTILPQVLTPDTVLSHVKSTLETDDVAIK